MKLLHIIPHVSEEASGPSYSVPRLCENLAALGHDVELSCLAARSEVPGVRLDVHAQWPIFKRFAISHTHALALYKKAQEVDIVHNHSLWSMVNMASGLLVPGHRAKLVTSPRGTLSAWALSRAQHIKRVLWPFQRRVLEKADLLHATSEVEYQEIRERGFKAPVVIIPNGIDLPELPLIQKNGGPMRTLLYLGRIHPIKGLDRLLGAWRRLQDAHPDWRLVVAGPGEPAHVREVREMARALSRVEFPGAVYGAQKSAMYFEAELFVLPTHSENFGMVVAEALSHACPAVVSKGAPWSGLVDEDCGWWVENDVASLAETLDKAMGKEPGALAGMGNRGRAWMQREFGWKNIAERMSEAYGWIFEQGTPPPMLRLN